MTFFDFLDKHPWFGLLYLITAGISLRFIGTGIASTLPSRYRCTFDPFEGCSAHPDEQDESKTIEKK